MPSVLGRELVIVRGSGAYVTTESGDELLDGTACLWRTNVGHGRAEIADAVAAQIRQLETYHVFDRFANQAALDLAERLRELSPVADSRVFFTSGGSDAVELACKLSRRYWQAKGRESKQIVVSRANSYHGLHAYGTSIAGLGGNREGYGSESLIPETARIPHSDLEGALEAIDHISPDRVASIVVEPIMGTGGVITAPPGYLSGLRDYCLDNDILFIADEVITGFGRAGEMFASTRFDLEPDMVLVAKGITSGYLPLGGVLIAPTVWEPFYASTESPVFRHGLTYSGHSACCAAAMANLDILEREKLVDRAGRLEQQLRQSLTRLEDLPGVAEVRAGAGFMAGIRLIDELNPSIVVDAMLDRGIITRAINDGVLQISPPFVISEADLTRLVDQFHETIDEAYQGLEG